MPAIIALALAASAAACSGDLNIGEYSFACEKDSDCAGGQRCDPGAGCVAAAGGVDAGHGKDAGDSGSPPDGSRDAGVRDAGDGGDAGHADTGDDDAGADDTGVDDAGGDVGHHDAGAPDGGGYVIRFSSMHDTAAGASTAPGFVLKSVTGWSAGFRWSAGGYTLQSGEPYRR